MTTLPSDPHKAMTGWTKIDNETILRAAEVGAAFPVYCLLRMHARESNECFPSVACMAEEVRTSRMKIIRSVSALEAAGWITVQRVDGKGSVYTLPPLPPVYTGNEGVTGNESVTTPVTKVLPDRSRNCYRTGNESVTRKKTKKKTQEEHTRKNTRDHASIPIPDGLDTPPFQTAWNEWLAYRRERKLTCTPQTLSGQLAKLAKLGPTGAVAEIGNSITNGWQSVCYENERKHTHGHTTRPPGPGQRHPDDTAARSQPGTF